jgi:hypothetical protein
LAVQNLEAGPRYKGIPEEDEFAGVARPGGDFVIGFDRTRIEEWGLWWER